MTDSKIQNFRSALQRNALEQLQQSQTRLQQELDRYTTPTQWATLHLISNKDEQLRQFQNNAVRNLTTFVQQNFDSTRLPGIFPASSSLQESRDHIITLIGKDRIEALTPTKRNEFENLLNRLRMLLTSLSSPVINCDNNTQHWLF
jgi:hypothetical protein